MLSIHSVNFQKDNGEGGGGSNMQCFLNLANHGNLFDSVASEISVP